ncbi:unnamed protein product [Discula destructiva]
MGLMTAIPESWVPYAQLWRVDKPAGYYAIYMPYIIGLGLGACLAESAPSLATLLYLAGIFTVGSVFLRGAGCIWNDVCDQDFDKQVERCKSRPIARGAVNTKQAMLFLLGTVLVGAPLLALLPLSSAAHGIPITGLTSLYPFAKRVTMYPQLVLGLPLAWAVFMSVEAAGGDLTKPTHLTASCILFVAVVVWTMVYDTIYAHQDQKDDIKAGVKSMAVRFANSTKTLSTALSCVQIGLLIALGRVLNMDAVYYSATCCGTAIMLMTMIVLVDLSQGKECMLWFYRCLVYGGMTMSSGLFATYVAKQGYFASNSGIAGDVFMQGNLSGVVA